MFNLFDKNILGNFIDEIKMYTIEKNKLLKNSAYNIIEENHHSQSNKHNGSTNNNNKNSPNSSYPNQLTLDIIEDSYKFVTNIMEFDIIESVKERFVDISKDILEKSININDFINNEEIIKNKKIQLKKDLKEKILLKSCLIDELGFSNFKGNGFEPKYNYFKKDDKIIIRVEVPGNCNFNVKLSHTGEYTIIKINGIKRKDLEPLNIEDNIHNTREFGEFNINILIKTEDFFIKNQKPEQILKNGVLIISYLIDETQNSIKLSTEDEI
jgi:HSP20 family molecular chaperone IbpA